MGRDVRPGVLQKIVGLLQKLTEEASDIYCFARLIDTGIGRIEVFCEHPATCPPDIPIGKHTKSKAPARSIIISVLDCLQGTIQRTYNSWSMVKCGLIEARKNSVNSHGKGYSTCLPAGVDTGSLVEEVGGDFVRVQDNH